MASYTEMMGTDWNAVFSFGKNIFEAGSSMAKSAAAGYSAVKNAVSPPVPVPGGSNSDTDFMNYFKGLKQTNYTPYFLAGGAALLLILLLKGGRQPYGVVYAR